MSGMFCRRIGMVALMVAAAAGMAACTKGVEGTYENELSKSTIELKRGGKAILGEDGKVREETTWEIIGSDKVIIHGKAGNMQLKVTSDGNLSMPEGVMVFKRK